MKDSYETLKVERIGDHLLLVKFNRPDSANALNTQMGRDMRDLWGGFYIDQEDIRCIVVTGEGDRFFCAGGDLKERNNMTDETWQQQHALFEQGVTMMTDCPIPVVAAVNGAAFGGGCEFVLACDFAYGAKRARFGLPEITLGIMPGAMGTQNLPRAVGVRRAKEIILSGKPFTADEACDWGILNKVCDDDKLMDETLEIAQKICDNAPISTRQAKKSMNVATQTDLKTGYAFEIEAYNRMVPTEDRLEGVRAFNEKRKAQFKGR